MLKSNLMQNVIMFALIAIALVPILSPDLAFLKRSVDFSVQLMLAYLVLGLGFLIIGKKRLLFTSFACCGALCLFLKQSSNSNLNFPQVTKEDKISIAHFNTSSASEGYSSLLDAVIKSEADIVSFQEVTPDWDLYLKNNLSAIYPHSASNVRIDPYGMAVFSKFAINNHDTFNYQEIPNQIVNIPISEDQNINIISAHVLPPFGQRLNERAKLHLNTIASQVNNCSEPSIVVGDFNLVYWSNEIRSFTDEASLENSRRDVSQNLLQIPYDHIFFSDKLECTGFQEVSDTISNHVGILGTYQIKQLVEIRESKVPSFFFQD